MTHPPDPTGFDELDESFDSVDTSYEPFDPALEAELAAQDRELAQSLAQLLRPPADLESRTESVVSTSLLNRSVLGTTADLLAVGWHTLRFLVSEPDQPRTDQPPTDHSHPEEVTPT